MTADFFSPHLLSFQRALFPGNSGAFPRRVGTLKKWQRETEGRREGGRERERESPALVPKGSAPRTDPPEGFQNRGQYREPTFATAPARCMCSLSRFLSPLPTLSPRVFECWYLSNPGSPGADLRNSGIEHLTCPKGSFGFSPHTQKRNPT